MFLQLPSRIIAGGHFFVFQQRLLLGTHPRFQVECKIKDHLKDRLLIFMRHY